MKTAKNTKSAALKAPRSVETRLNLQPAVPAQTAQPASKYRAGDMDFLERDNQKALSPAAEQFDRGYKSAYNFLGLPLPIV